MSKGCFQLFKRGHHVPLEGWGCMLACLCFFLMGLHDPSRANSDLPRISAKDTKHTRALKRGRKEAGARESKREMQVKESLELKGSSKAGAPRRRKKVRGAGAKKFSSKGPSWG